MKRVGTPLGYKEAGYLPDISGFFYNQYNNMAVLFGDQSQSSGVFYTQSLGNHRVCTNSSSIVNNATALNFSASRSSSVYANVDGVYPKNLAVYGYLIKF